MLIAIIVILAVCLLVYLFFPFLKKFVKSLPEKLKLRKKVKTDKKEAKKNLKIEKQQDDEMEKEEQQQVEDPDIHVEQNNLDIDGFFETNFTPKREENNELKNDFDDIYDQLFSG